MNDVPPAVSELAVGLAGLGWVRDVWVAGSLATGDYVPGVSDLDLVAVVDAGPSGTPPAASHLRPGPPVTCVACI
jgi:hypothetical protein